MRTKEGNAERLRRVREGAAVADALSEKRSLKEVAEITGLTPWGVRQIECLAFYKLKKKILEQGLKAFRVAPQEPNE